MNIKAQKGTKDILPEEYFLRNKVEKAASEVFESAGVRRIETPIFEATELFQRGVGDGTDIVTKEMYTFEKSERSLTLRPENTAGVVRAFLEHNMQREIQPVKLWYYGPMFRYERPQAGRQRQFTQIGTEMFGSKDASLDAECISLAVEFLAKIGLSELFVELNSIGCADCRTKFKTKLKDLLAPVLSELCADCQNRYKINPLRLLDCKNENCIKLFEENKILERLGKIELCEECSEHYEKLKSYLNALGVKYVENPLLVRGLDYYTGTVFEIKSEALGAQSAVCGGGRYDNLTMSLGGVNSPAVGWAVGVERICSLIEKQQIPKIDYFVVSQNPGEALKLAKEIRSSSKKSAITDYSARKFAKQLEKASKTANFAVILGEDELANGTVSVKNLEKGEQTTVSRTDFLKNL